MGPKTQRMKRMQLNKRSHFNITGEPGTTTLLTPIVRIESHKSEVLSCGFHPSGKYFLSSNREGEIHVSDIYGTFKKIMVMKGHAGPVLEAHFSRDGFDVYSCSTDATIGIWDTFKGYRRATLEGHTSSVNSLERTRSGYPLLCSGSSDGTVKLWDIRDRKSTLTLQCGTDVTAACFNDVGQQIFSGGLDNDILIWDIRMKALLARLTGHKDTVTGISLSPCGSYLLSHSADNSIRVWDVMPFTAYERGVSCFPSNQTNVQNLLRCGWSPDGKMISAGTAENDVYIWDAVIGQLLYALPGHEDNINDIAFHPTESIILSASNDKYLFLHEI